MKTPIALAALMLAAPATAQVYGTPGPTGGIVDSGTWGSGWQAQSFGEAVQGRDYKSNAIDRRNSARYWSAKAARKLREAKERDARRAARAEGRY